jgi:2'-5' RNA ligase
MGERHRAGEAEHAEVLRDHWWWRPGWREGRRFSTWHLTFEGQQEVTELAAGYRSALDGLPVDVVPARWLHLTMQGLGFVDEVEDGDVQRIVAAAHERLAPLASFEVRLGDVRVDPEAVMLTVTPEHPVTAVRGELRAAIADVWGPDHVPEAAEGFRPHVSLGYVNAAGPAAGLVDAVRRAPTLAARATITAASLIVLHRDHRMYEWEPYASVPLSLPAAGP